MENYVGFLRLCLVAQLGTTPSRVGGAVHLPSFTAALYGVYRKLKPKVVT